MSTNLQNLEYNQTVPYQGGYARVISESYNGKVWVEFNGERLLIDKNDIFGINQQKENLMNSFQTRIDNAQEDYRYYSSKIDSAQQVCRVEEENQSFIRKQMSKLLSFCTDKRELEGKKEDEYRALEAQYSSSRSLAWRAGSDIITYSIWAADAAYHKHDIQCQQMIAESMLG